MPRPATAPAVSSLLLAFGTMLVAACGAGPPDPAKLERAQRLVAEAESVRAARYAAAELTTAREALAAAEAEYAAQERALGFRRSPEKGHELAERAARLAEEATKRARSQNRAAARRARDAITRAETAVVSAEAALAKLARCHRESPIKGLRAYAERLADLQKRMATATAHFDEGEYAEVGEVSGGVVGVSETLVTDAEHTVWGAGCR